MKVLSLIVLVVVLMGSCVTFTTTTHKSDETLFFELVDDKRDIKKGFLVPPGTTIEIDFKTGEMTVFE